MRLAAAAVLTLVLAFPALGAPAPRGAALKLESLAPLAVSGRHFGGREPVLLTYLAADLTRRVIGVRAKRNGSFKATFGFRVDRCAGFTVRAAGLDGSRAVLQVEPSCKKRKGPPKRAPASAADPTTV
jgi:hypothetical protein